MDNINVNYEVFGADWARVPRTDALKQRVDVLRKALVSMHDDGDDDSLYCRLADLINYTQYLEAHIQTRKRMAQILENRIEAFNKAGKQHHSEP